MHLDEEGTGEDPGPYWVTEFPWVKDKSDLVNNKAAVQGVMIATEKKLAKDSSWRSVYDRQLMDLIEMKVARVVTEEELKSWTASGGETYYISHQMAPNPSSKTTPVRVVFNSSQKYKGHSLNNSWELGTDVMTYV